MTGHDTTEGRAGDGAAHSADSERYPYAQDLDGAWHARSVGDTWNPTVEGLQCRTRCGKRIRSVRVSEFEPEPDPSTGSTLCPCVTRPLGSAGHEEFAARLRRDTLRAFGLKPWHLGLAPVPLRVRLTRPARRLWWRIRLRRPEHDDQAAPVTVRARHGRVTLHCATCGPIAIWRGSSRIAVPLDELADRASRHNYETHLDD